MKKKISRRKFLTILGVTGGVLVAGGAAMRTLGRNMAFLMKSIQMGKLKKLSKVKELDAEYSKLLTEKKAAYPDYRKAKDEMQELLRAQPASARCRLKGVWAQPNKHFEFGFEKSDSKIASWYQLALLAQALLA